jgi:hypothetical protein
MRGQSIALRGVEYGVALHVGDFPFGFLALGVGLGAGDAVGIDHELGEASTFSGVTFAAAGAHVSGRNSGQWPDCGCDVEEGCVSPCSDIYCMNANDETFHTFHFPRKPGNGWA